MQSNYSPVDLASDASNFATSRFGKHYLERLEQIKERELRVAMDTRYSESFRAHAATKAAAVTDELDYFQTAQTIRNKPELLSRLSAKLALKKKGEPIDV